MKLIETTELVQSINFSEHVTMSLLSKIKWTQLYFTEKLTFIKNLIFYKLCKH